jgi:hypothetical protein
LTPTASPDLIDSPGRSMNVFAGCGEEARADRGQVVSDLNQGRHHHFGKIEFPGGYDLTELGQRFEAQRTALQT